MKGTSAFSLGVVILTLALGIALTIACGGPEKPPLQPDGPDMQMPDAASSAAAPAK